MSADIDPTHFGAEKCDALHDAGFWWDDQLDMWVNPEKRLAISAFAVDECTLARLLEFAAKPSTETWQTLFDDVARAAACGDYRRSAAAVLSRVTFVASAARQVH